jgi:electron transfer flavoprotein alpha/beta subunit
MNIVVCIKQVPDTAEVRINHETGTLIREGVPSIINPYDMHAIEAALRIKDEKGGQVTALTMGPPQAEESLREAISLGVDEGFLLTGREFAGSDTLATSFSLASAIKKLSADIVICGKQAIDGDTSQVGPEVAEFLGIPHVSYVRKIVQLKDNSIKVERMMDDGYDLVEATLPSLITVVRELNVPRLPSLRGKMAAKKAVIKKWGAGDIEAPVEKLGFSGSPTQVKRIFTPEPRGERQMLAGSPEEMVEALVKELIQKKCL